MKTVTITISDEVAEKLAEHASENGRSVEDWVARVIEHTYEPDWTDGLSAQEVEMIEEGLAQAERGDVAPHDEVFSRIHRKF